MHTSRPITLKYIFVKIDLFGEIRLFLLLSKCLKVISPSSIFIATWILLGCACHVNLCLQVTCVCMRKGQRSTVGVPPLVTLHPSFLRQGCSLNLELIALTNLAIQELHGLTCPYPAPPPPQHWGYRPIWDSPSGPHAFKVCASPTKPSPGTKSQEFK